jgi:predicted DNA-binding transcriptional regulator AlpA
MSLEELLCFKDLRRLGVVSSWAQLKSMQKKYSFPAGLLLGANSRAWRASEVEQWLASCPVEPSQHVLKRVAKSVRARQEAAAAA